MNRKILIIEDEADIANVFKKQLDLKGGYDVDLAPGGGEGLEMMAQNKYDLVLMDLVMPKVDGIEVLKKVNAESEKYNKSPIIALTNITGEDTKKEVENLGVIKFVVKTDVDIDVLVDEFFGGEVKQ
ncbi:MAG TPA: response regulator [Candidatus Dojkabacteria bacterium]|jgi:DNA-binding response OmpR family regulator